MLPLTARLESGLAPFFDRRREQGRSRFGGGSQRVEGSKKRAQGSTGEEKKSLRGLREQTGSTLRQCKSVAVQRRSRADSEIYLSSLRLELPLVLVTEASSAAGGAPAWR